MMFAHNAVRVDHFVKSIVVARLLSPYLQEMFTVSLIKTTQSCHSCLFLIKRVTFCFILYCRNVFFAMEWNALANHPGLRLST